jgi:myxalamid-type polyketide synthase MxaE and MxaD
VTVESADVADRRAMEKLFARFGDGRTALRGIVHAAAALPGDELVEMTRDTLEAILAPKVAGAWVLHELSRTHSLDFFVMFSSAMALLGSHRLGHYAAANQFLDALAHHRRREGRPAVSVNWGTWDVMRAASAADQRRFAEGGLHPMPTAQALAVLGRLAGTDAAQFMVAAVNWTTLKAMYEVRRRRPFLDEVSARAEKRDTRGSRKQATLLERLADTPADARGDVFLDCVRGEVARVLGLGPDRPIDCEQGLFDLGMDSLMAIQIRSGLEAAVGQRLPSSLVFNYPTISALAGYLSTQTLASAAGPTMPARETVAPPPTRASTGDAADDSLSEDELATLLADRLRQIPAGRPDAREGR